MLKTWPSCHVTEPSSGGKDRRVLSVLECSARAVKLRTRSEVRGPGEGERRVLGGLYESDLLRIPN